MNKLLIFLLLFLSLSYSAQGSDKNYAKTTDRFLLRFIKRINKWGDRFRMELLKNIIFVTVYIYRPFACLLYTSELSRLRT